MENNEKSSPEDVKDEAGDEDAKDWKAEAAKYRAIADRKEKKLQEFLKGKDKKDDKKEKSEKKDDSLISKELKILYRRTGGTNTELRYLEKVMKATGKDFEEAMKDGLFVAWKEQNDAKIKSKESKLGPAGSSSVNKDKEPKPITETEKKFADYISTRTERNIKNFKSEAKKSK